MTRNAQVGLLFFVGVVGFAFLFGVTVGMLLAR